MKFEIDPNELTTDQRAHVAAFITNWPHADEVDHAGEAELRRHNRLFGDRIDPLTYTSSQSEEQRLDAEQKSDLINTASDLTMTFTATQNLNAIFGTPDIAKEVKQGIADRAEIAANLNSLVPLDKEGIPWDSRIHASTKTLIADGSWKLRRGVDPAEVEKVKAQLKELMAVPKFTDLTSELMNVAINTPNADNEVAQALVDAARVPVPPAPKSIDQQPTVTLTDLIGRMSKAIAENRLTQASITEICVKHGVSEFHLLSNRPDLLPLIDADMKAMGV